MTAEKLEASPLISICMPAYNASKYIAQAVESILAQTYTNWELIIVNDGSTDYTTEVLSQFIDGRITVIHQANQGQCAAANKAFSVSKGELIKFFDADDILPEDCLLNQTAAIAGDQQTIAYGGWGRFYNDDLSTFTLQTDEITGDMTPADWLIASMTGKEVMLQCARWLIPRELLQKAGMWLEELSLINDFEFIIRLLLKADQLKYVPNAALCYRSGIQKSLSGARSGQAAASAYHSIDLGTQHLLNFSDTPQTRRITADCFQRFVYNFYPQHQELIKKATSKVNEMGGSQISFPCGGITRIFNALIGWKATKRLKRVLS